MAEDRRIALAALVVAAVVPLATLWATTEHDRNRLHAEQAQADRAELRKVLDDAADSLHAATTAFGAAFTSGRDLDRPTVVELQDEIMAIHQRYNSVAIRLGRTSRAARQMRRASDAAVEMFQLLELPAGMIGGDGRRAPDPEDEFRVIEAFQRQSERFIDEAHRVARSTTD